MVTIRTTDEIILALIDYFRLAQPNLSLNPGSVARDLFIDAPSSQLSLLYNELSGVSDQQSLRLVVGSDLDKLAKNFGVVRKLPTPSAGVALITFTTLDAPVIINRGDYVYSNNGFAFSVNSSVTLDSSSANFYRSVAAKYRDQLDFVGISDEYAIELTVTSVSNGSAGNISKYSLNRTSISNASNVTNINSFTGGTDQESDATFRDRVLSVFSGSSVGTALGYLNTALATSGVQDARVIEPGNPLMTRDGTITTKSSNGTLTVVSEGTGGKVDVVVLGSNLVENTDTYIYQDKSNNNDPTDSKNDIVLGQIAADANKTINRKRVDDIANGELPAQPVSNILEVSGSLSGSNFQSKSVDSLGRISGNYELLKDTGTYANSPWGFDKLHWISNKVSLFSDDRIKNQFNGQDTLTFTDVTEIHKVEQNIPITNENSNVISTDRTLIQLLHYPATNVTRVFNVNTGERYIIANQNLNDAGVNISGIVQISGNTLPTTTDILQVDYNWIVTYDQYSDYDGLVGVNNPRDSVDTVDWGFSSSVRQEFVKFTQDISGDFYSGKVSIPPSVVISANKFLEIDGYVQLITSGIFVNRYKVVLQRLSSIPTTIDSIKLKNTNIEIYNTNSQDQNFSTQSVVVGVDLYYSTTVILPSDTPANLGDYVTALIDSQDTFTVGQSVGTVNSTDITIPSTNINYSAASEITLKVSYIGNVQNIFSSGITSLPSSRSGNGFALSNISGFTNFSNTNCSRREHQTIQLNTFSQFYVELSINNSEFLLTDYLVVSVIRLSDGLELWNSSNIGSITTGTNGNYQIILNGFNSPVTGEKVLVVYYANDLFRFQPFSFSNYMIEARVDSIFQDISTGDFAVKLNNIQYQTGLDFEIIEPNTNIVLFNGLISLSGSDGYLIPNTNNYQATFGSTTINFNIPDIINKKVVIKNCGNTGNDGVYDILNYDTATNSLEITNNLKHINNNQISIIRILDGKEIFNSTSTINYSNNLALMSASTQVSIGDKVLVLIYNYDNLRQSPTRLSINISDQVNNPGTLTILGTTIFKAEDIVFTATKNGLQQNVSDAVRNALGLSSISPIPSNLKLVRIAKLEKVTTTTTGDNEVLSIDALYDLKNTQIKNNILYSNDFLQNSSLSDLDFILPDTINNTLDLEIHNLIKQGDKLRITFYYTLDSDSESLVYTRNGILYTNKKFTYVTKIFAASGFKSSLSTNIICANQTQPISTSRYKAFYDYLAPKPNERINVRFNYNKLISDVTFAIENSRPINADVLAKAAKLLQLDLTINVVIADKYKSQSTTVLQNLRDKLISTLTSTQLGVLIDIPTILSAAQSISGIDRARVIYFNTTGSLGSVSEIQAQEDEYFEPNNLIINTENR